jgi:hypothetical protein
MLSFRQQIHQNRVAVRKCERIAMLLGRARRDLAKLGNTKARILG